MLRSRSTGGRLIAEPTRRADGRPDGTDDDADQGEVLEAAEPRGEALGDARLLVRAPARAAPEREARSRRRGHRQETAPAPDADPRAERRQTRHTGAPGPVAGTRGSRPAGTGTKIRGSATAPGARHAGEAARSPAGEARRERTTTVRAGGVLPLREGSDEGSVFGRRSAGADRRGGNGDRRPDGRHGRRDPACAREDAGDAGAGGRDRRADGVGFPRGLHVRPNAPRPRARADGLPVTGRPGARADEEGSRDRRGTEGAREVTLSRRSRAPRVRPPRLRSRRGERGKPRVSRARQPLKGARPKRADSKPRAER